MLKALEILNERRSDDDYEVARKVSRMKGYHATILISTVKPAICDISD
jgi:hypothetical protein